MPKGKRSAGILLLTLVLVTSVSFASKAHADLADLTVETGCTDTASYNGELQPAAGSYDLYARLGRRGDRAQVQGYTQLLGQQGVCNSLSSVTTTGDSWTKIGSFTADGTNTYIFQLSSTSLAALPSANRPTVMLVPQSNPVCVPTTECIVTINGQQGYVEPPGTLLNQNSLHVLQVANPRTDAIQSVDYYADDRLVYTLPTLRSFDLRYLSSDTETATAIVHYASGQQVVLPQHTPATYVYENPFNMLFRFYHSAPLLPKLLVGVTASVLLVWAALFGLERWHQYRSWKEHHGLTAYEQQHYTPRQQRFAEKRARIVHILAPTTKVTLLIVGILTVLVATNSYAATIYTIDGESMQNTYMNGHRVLVNRLPVTWAHANRREYIPKRGDVIIVRAVFGNTNASTANSVNLFLIKRVIGLPGDHLIIAGGHVTIYNNAHPAGFDVDAGQPWVKTMHPNVATESLDITLGPSEIFVSGDNRPESIDSRFNGPLHMDDIVGQVVSKLP